MNMNSTSINIRDNKRGLRSIFSRNPLNETIADDGRGKEMHHISNNFMEVQKVQQKDLAEDESSVFNMNVNDMCYYV